MELFWHMMALVVPATVVVIITRISRNKYVAVVLTFVLFATAIHRGFFYSEWTIFLDALSIVIGLMLVEIFNLENVENDD